MTALLTHPGFILILTGLIAALLPAATRRYALIGGPLLALLAMVNLPLDTLVQVPFVAGFDIMPLAVDKLSWVFGLIFAMMAAIGGIYSAHNKSRTEALASMAYAGSALWVTLAGDWVTFVFFWELLALSSVFLILASRTQEAKKAGLRYFLVHMFGGNMVLVGVLLKLSQGDVAIENLATNPDMAFWFILVGVAINAAIPPVNAWLPDAYPEGTITGSVFLSSFTTKVAVYALIRIFAGTEFLAWAGALMAIYGVIYAVVENDMRRLLSYHIISQVGFMVCGIGIGTAMALDGATAHAFSHILYKSLLFMSAGAVIYTTGIRKIDQLGGLAKKMPFVALVFTIAAFSISGVPFFNGFISKSITMSAAVEAGYGQLYLLMLLASVGTFLSITLKMIYFIFFGEDKGLALVRPLPTNMMVAMAIGAGLCVIYGVYPDLLYRFLPFGTDYTPYTLDHILQYAQLLAATAVPFFLLLPKMAPHPGLTLDFDWFYRKPLVALVKFFAYMASALRVSLGKFFREIYDRYGDVAADPLAIIGPAHQGEDQAPGYSPGAYRALIAEPILLTFLGLMIVIAAVFIVVL